MCKQPMDETACLKETKALLQGKVIDLYCAGMQVKDIVKSTAVPTSTVYHWIDKHMRGPSATNRARRRQAIDDSLTEPAMLIVQSLNTLCGQIKVLQGALLEMGVISDPSLTIK
jgi:hypothetical protein